MRYARFPVVLLTLIAASGCNTNDGRTLQDPPPGATAPTLAPSTTDPSNPGDGVREVDVLATMSLRSTAFADGGVIPSDYACDGLNESPPLSWTGIPEGTKELAITMIDPSPGLEQEPFTHWVLAGIDPSTNGLDTGATPEGAVIARNGVEDFSWYGPCPPPGQTHTYVFTLYALTAPSNIAQGANGIDAIAALGATGGFVTTLTASYTAGADAGEN